MPIQLTASLENVDDLTLIMAIKMPENGRLYYYGRATDDEQCEADRHECFMTKEEAAERKFPPLDTYDTHGDKVAWMPHGRLWKAPGGWAMMTGHFAEPSIGSLISPGKDWVILRTRLTMMRRQRSQGVVELAMGYPHGLTFHAIEPYLIDDFIIFRGKDVEGPEQVGGVELKRDGGDVVLTWKRSKDNTLTAFYVIKADDSTLVETHLLTSHIKTADATGKALTVVAYDLYGNASKPSDPVDPGK